jgi:hypothetical protein
MILKRYYCCLFFVCSILLSISLNNPHVVKATGDHFETDFTNGIWYDVNGELDNELDFRKAPFTIVDNGLSFIYSSGRYYDDSPTMNYRLGSHNSSSLDYHNFNHSSLTKFTGISSDLKQAVIALNTPFINTRISNIQFSWTSKSSETQSIHLIYSLDDNITWSSLAVDDTNKVDNTISFANTLDGNSLSIGILATYNINYFHNLVNPTIAFDYQPLSDNDSAQAFATLVGGYTPCIGDEDLTFATEEIAVSLSEQYASLSYQAKEIFNQMEFIDTEVRYYDRYQFILSKYNISEPLSTLVNSLSINFKYFGLIMMMIIPVTMIAINKGNKAYGKTK